jgi:hypothetical protein
LARYGPEAKDARALLLRSVTAGIERFWLVTLDPGDAQLRALVSDLEKRQAH